MALGGSHAKDNKQNSDKEETYLSQVGSSDEFDLAALIVRLIDDLG